MDAVDAPVVLLSAEEENDLHNLEERIHNGLEGFLEVGRAMFEIRDRRLYRANYASWDDYCERKWNISGRHGSYQLTAMLKTVEISNQPGTVVLPAKESQTRPIDLDFEPAEKGLIWNRAVQKAGGAVPSAKIVKEERDRFVVEQSRYPYVQTLVNNCYLTADRAAALVVELDAAPDKTLRDFLVTQEVRDPSLTRELVRLYRDKRESFSEIRATGVLQTSTRTTPLKNASLSDLRAFLDERMLEHRLAAQEAKNADKRVHSTSGLFWHNSPEQMYKELARVLSLDDLRGLKTILNARVV